METKLNVLNGQFSAALNDFKAALDIDITQFDEGTADVIKNGQGLTLPFYYKSNYRKNK